MNKLVLVGVILVSIAVIGFTAGALGLTDDVKITGIVQPKASGDAITTQMVLETKDLSDTKVTTTKTIEVAITKKDYTDCQLTGLSEADCIKYLKETTTKYLAQQYIAESQAVQEAKDRQARTPTYKDFTPENLLVTQKDVEEQIIVASGSK